MAERKGSFRGGYSDASGVEYSADKVGDTVHVDATSHNGEKMSSAQFEIDPSTGDREVVPGSLDLHPDHASAGVGRIMRTIANTRYKH